MIQKTLTTLFAGMESRPAEFCPADVMDAFLKVDRILETAFLRQHVDTADRLFANMLTRYGFNQNDRTSPLIVGMQERINKRRAEVERQWQDMNGMAA